MSTSIVPTPSDTDSAGEWIFRMEVSEPLPLINLERTPISTLLSEDNHTRFLDLMRRHYARFSSLYRASGALLLTTLLVPTNVGYWLTVPAMLTAIPALSCSVLMSSSDILRILPRQYEFWFFTVLNAINWGCLASFYSDFRVVSLFGGIFGTQSVILIDANFRTVTSGIRSTTIAAPVLLMLGAATFFRIIDTEEDNYRVIPVAKVKVTLVDVFVNTAVTLAIFIARKGYAKRKVLITQLAKLQTIRCVVFRSKLQLKKPPERDADLRSLRTETRMFVMQHSPDRGTAQVVRTISSFSTAPKSLRPPARADVVPFQSDSSRSIDETKLDGMPAGTDKSRASSGTDDGTTCENQQQVTLVTMQLNAIDIRHVVAPQLTPLHAPLSPIKALIFHTNAFVGFATTVFTLTRRPAGSEFPPTNIEYALATTALVTTLVFFLTCVASYHRALAKSLLHNFDFLFSSVQFTLAMLLICDMVNWDFRTLGAMAWLLWFHSVLFLDALTPPIKRNLRFRKVFLLPVIMASLLGIVFIIYGFFFSNVAEYFVERTIWETRFHNKTIGLRTKSLLMNRLFTVLLWSFRLIWEVAGCPDDELIFIRGGLDYLSPMEMFPPVKSLKSLAPRVLEAAAVRGSRIGQSIVRRWMERRRAILVPDTSLKGASEAPSST